MEDENPLEHKEHLDELADHRSGWTRYLALSTAIVAVLAALSSLRSGDLVNEALIAKSDAVLAQSRAADQYAFFQAKGIKKSIAEQQLAAKPSEDLRQQIDRYAREQQDIKAEADRDAAEVATHEKESPSPSGEAPAYRFHSYRLPDRHRARSRERFAASQADVVSLSGDRRCWRWFRLVGSRPLSVALPSSR